MIAIPIKVGIEPMERLLIASFTGDSEYEALEPQMFDDNINGKGLRILRYRKDKKVDVYWQPGVTVDPSAFSIGEGFGDFQETVIDPAHFEISDKGVDLHCAFTDIQGRRVEFLVRENTTDSKRLPFLAPVGNDIKKPKQLFLAYMNGFDFIRKAGTEFIARVGERTLKPSGFPLLRDYKRVLFIRYSTKPVIGTFNPPMSAPVVFEYTGNSVVNAGDMQISIGENRSVTGITAEHKESKVAIEFPKGFPNLLELDQRIKYTGMWNYLIEGIKIIGGTYCLKRNDKLIDVELDVTEPWNPAGLTMSLNILTNLASFFRKWPTTYRWRGIVDIGGEPKMSGSWERKNNR